MERDLFKRAGRLMSLGRKHFSVTQDRFDDYLAEIAFEARRARRMYDLLVIPGAGSPRTTSGAGRTPTSSR